MTKELTSSQIEELKQALKEKAMLGIIEKFKPLLSTLFESYQEKVGRKTTREGFYALLKRHGWVKKSRDFLRREIKLT